MIVTSAKEFLDEYSPERFPCRAAATARGAFLVSPLGFALAEQSASDNRYMDMQRNVDAQRALIQHAVLAAELASELPVIAFPGDASMPDAVFPNNVFATVPGSLIVGAMRHAVRRREAARADIRGFFRDVLGYRIVDLSECDVVAELTGALVIDRARGIGYCGLSERCDLAGARAMHEAFGLKLTFAFELAPGEYHTNVVLAVLAGRAVIAAADGFVDPQVVGAIARVYNNRVLQLDGAQKKAFAGNAIALTPTTVWLSTAGLTALSAEQCGLLESWGLRPRTVALDEIEKAGGSLRCCVAEIF
jgi:hypothetical protein